MQEEFYCSLKLVSGEEIFSLIYIEEENEEPIIVMQNPVIMKVLESNKGQYITVKPWMEIPNDDFYFIKPDKVITMTEVTDSLIISLYTNYLNSDNEQNDFVEDQTGKVKISEKMGYISTVDNARKKLEEVYKKNTSNKSDKTDKNDV
jgi:hypothetical protein